MLSEQLRAPSLGGRGGRAVWVRRGEERELLAVFISS